MFSFPPCHGVSQYENLTLFFSCIFFIPKKLGTARGMDKRGGHTNTGEGVNDKKTRTTSDDVGGKSVSENRESFGHHQSVSKKFDPSGHNQ